MSDTVQAVRNAKGTHILINLLLFIFFTHAVHALNIICLSAKQMFIEQNKKRSFNSSSMLDYTTIINLLFPFFLSTFIDYLISIT